MISQILEWLGISLYNLSDDVSVIITFVIGMIILGFVLDILRYILYYISRR